MAIPCFTQLTVWQKSHALVLDIYRLTRRFPDDERFGLSCQMRRSATSVPANIAEGFARRRGQDKARFYNIARASAEELKYYLILSRDLHYLKEDDPLRTRLEEVCRMLHAMTERTADRC